MLKASFSSPDLTNAYAVTAAALSVPRSRGNPESDLQKTLAFFGTVYYNSKKANKGDHIMNKIQTIARPAERKVTGCGECRSTCQSACKTSCTVGNQSCERISRENDPEKNN